KGRKGGGGGGRKGGGAAGNEGVRNRPTPQYTKNSIVANRASQRPVVVSSRTAAVMRHAAKAATPRTISVTSHTMLVASRAKPPWTTAPASAAVPMEAKNATNQSESGPRGHRRRIRHA